MSKGLQIFTLAKKCIKGWFPTTKGGENNLIPFVGLSNEEKLMYYFEYNPEVVYVERADVSEEFAKKYSLKKSPLLPIVIEYEYEEKIHKYYPDFFVQLASGQTIIVEVGDPKEKRKKRALTKAIAAIEYCKKYDWEYWLIPGDRIMTDIRYNNLLLLKAYDKSMYTNYQIQQNILEILTYPKNDLSIKDIVNLIGKKYSETEVEMALYEYINYAVKRGKLNFDIENNRLDGNSIVSILSDDKQRIVPKRINLTYEEVFNLYNEVDKECTDDSPEYSFTVLDPEHIPEDEKEVFFKRRLAVLEAISINRKESISAIAAKYGLSRSRLYHYMENYIKHGDAGLINYNSYSGKQTYLQQDIANIVIKLIHKKPVWGTTALIESDEFKRELTNLAKKKNAIISAPNYYQVYRFMKNYKCENADNLLDVRHRGNKGKVSDYGSFVRSIVNNLDVVQVDAHWIDIKITTKDRTRIAGKIWAIVFIDVKTANIIGYSLSLKTPMEEDYMRALKCSIEPKDILVKKFNCENIWPCNGISRKIMSDNGKIFISKRSTDVLVKRLGIVEEVAPPYMPDVKGSIEALFTWVVNRLITKMPGFTKGRDKKEFEKEALQAGITFEEFETMFVQAIVDVYNQEWDDLRGQSRYALWMASEKSNSFGTPKWIGSKDELKLLLMKEEQDRKVDRHGVSFKGRFYQNKEMLGGIVGKNVSIRYDKMDISVIYIYLNDGSYFCEAYCSELQGRRISIWELESERKTKQINKQICNQKPKKRMEKILGYANNRKDREKAAQAEEQARIFDTLDIHTESVNRVIESTRANKNVRDLVPVNRNVKKTYEKLDTRKI